MAVTLLGLVLEGRAVVLVLVPAVCGTAGVASAGAAAPSGPTLTAHPEQVRPGEAVAVTGAGWSRPATPPGRTSARS